MYVSGSCARDSGVPCSTSSLIVVKLASKVNGKPIVGPAPRKKLLVQRIWIMALISITLGKRKPQPTVGVIDSNTSESSDYIISTDIGRISN